MWQYPDGPTLMSSKQPVFGYLSSTLLAGLGSVEIIGNSDASLSPHTTHTNICTQTQCTYTDTSHVQHMQTHHTDVDTYTHNTHTETTLHIQYAHMHTYTHHILTQAYTTHTHLSHMHTDTHILKHNMHIYHRYNMHIHVSPQASSLLTWAPRAFAPERS